MQDNLIMKTVGTFTAHETAIANRLAHYIPVCQYEKEDSTPDHIKPIHASLEDALLLAVHAINPKGEYYSDEFDNWSLQEHTEIRTAVCILRHMVNRVARRNRVDHSRLMDALARGLTEVLLYQKKSPKEENSIDE